MIKIYTDGGARGNPGPAASAFVVFRDGKKVHEGYEYIGETTNNVAEYTAVKIALEWLKKNKEKFKENKVKFFLDSELVVNQLNGNYRIKSNRLRPLAIAAKSFEKKIENFSTEYILIPREKNKVSDALVNKTLDENS